MLEACWPHWDNVHPRSWVVDIKKRRRRESNLASGGFRGRAFFVSREYWRSEVLLRLKYQGDQT